MALIGKTMQQTKRNLGTIEEIEIAVQAKYQEIESIY
jgi:hypothetical protein